MASKLTPKQERFVDEYLKDLNATQAAIRAGYSQKNAHTIASQLLGKSQVSQQISKRRKALEIDCEITRERVVKEMARLAFFNIKCFFDDNGNPKKVSELTDDAACAINGIDIVNIGNDEVGFGQVIKYKIPDKNKALENLAKILGYFDKNTSKDENKESIKTKIIIQAYDASRSKSDNTAE